MGKQRLVGFRPKLISIAVASCFIADAALANPTGPAVVHGTATFNQAGNILRITNSPNAVINWQSFSIGANEITRFIQQSQASAVLNRVTGKDGRIDPSVILGTMKSNGKVYLINPNGVMFGEGARIDVAGLVAGSLNLSNADFLANRLRFTDGAGAGSVINNGTINTRPGGEVYLIGSAVTNGGVITSPSGEVVLAAGKSVELVNPGTPNLRVEVAATDNQAVNLGQIVAESGRIGIYAGLINNSGTIRAGSAVAEGGKILLKAKHNVTLDSSSVLDASGQGGGTIEVLAGKHNGGTVNVAGRLDASAPMRGDGGFIETSAENVKVADGTVITTAAARGQTGMWLVDPANFVIDVDGDISGSTVSDNLATTNQTFQTAGPGASLIVDDPISWSSSSTLTLMAHQDVNVNQPINNSGPGNISMLSGWSGSGTSVNAGTGNINITKNVIAGANVELVAGNILNVTGGQVVAGNDLLLRSYSEMNLAGASKVQGANITITSLFNGTVAIVPGPKSGGGLQLTQEDLDVLQITNPASGFLTLEGGFMSFSAPAAFAEGKVANLALLFPNGVSQSSSAPLTVKKLFVGVDGAEGGVSMLAPNHVQILAGRVNASCCSAGAFEFENAQSLVIGNVSQPSTELGGSGIIVNGNGTTRIEVTTTSGSLTVNGPVRAIAQDGGDGMVTLTGAGNVIVNSEVLARSNDSFNSYGGFAIVTSQEGDVRVNSGGSVTARGAAAYGGDAGVILQGANEVIVNGDLLAVAGSNDSMSGGNAAVGLHASDGAVTIGNGATVTATAGSGASSGSASILVTSVSSDVILDGNLTTTGNGTWELGPSGIFIQAGDAIVGGNGVLSTVRGAPSGGFPVIALEAVNGIGTQGKPVKIGNGAGAGQGELFFRNTGTEGDIAVAFTTGDVILDDLVGTFNANPNGTYFIEARAGDIIVAAPFKPGIETSDALLAGQSVRLKASGDVSLTTSAEPEGVLIGASGSIVTSGTGKIKIEAGGAISADAGTQLTASAIDLTAGTTITSIGSLTGGPVSASADGDISISQSAGIKLGLLESNNGVLISTGGAITDGNGGLNIHAHHAVLNGGGGVGTTANPIETLVNNLTGSASGSFSVLNSGDLNLLGLTFSGGDANIGSTGILKVVGAVSASSANVNLLANNGLVIDQRVDVSGDLKLHSGIGDMMIANTTVTANNIDMVGNNIFIGFTGAELPTSVIATNNITAMSAGNFNVLGGANAEAHTVLHGQNVNLTVGTTAGFLNIASGSDGATAKVSAGSSHTITLEFPNLASGGYFVNGVEGAIESGGTGFYTNGTPAVLGEGLQVTFGGTVTPPVTPPDPVIAAINNQIVANTNTDTTPPDEKDKDLIPPAPKDPADKEKTILPTCN